MDAAVTVAAAVTSFATVVSAAMAGAAIFSAIVSCID